MPCYFIYHQESSHCPLNYGLMLFITETVFVACLMTSLNLDIHFSHLLFFCLQKKTKRKQKWLELVKVSSCLCIYSLFVSPFLVIVVGGCDYVRICAFEDTGEWLLLRTLEITQCLGYPDLCLAGAAGCVEHTAGHHCLASASHSSVALSSHNTASLFSQEFFFSKLLMLLWRDPALLAA